MNQPIAAAVDEASLPFVGRWNRLVSTTNWEKGRIVCEWRAALLAAGRPPAEYSDEAWAQQVGGISPPHVGRLRRVYHRFGQVCAAYEGLYWSHFHAALDWDDAEMWLEGALQNDWTVAQMRTQRAETLGAAADAGPNDDEVFVAGLSGDDADDAVPPADRITGAVSRVVDPSGARTPAGEKEPASRGARGKAAGASREEGEKARGRSAEPRQPFAHVPSLPDDLAAALEAFKLGIVRRRVTGWEDVRPDDVLAALDALRELVLAPAPDR